MKKRRRYERICVSYGGHVSRGVAASVNGEGEGRGGHYQVEGERERGGGEGDYDHLGRSI